MSQVEHFASLRRVWTRALSLARRTAFHSVPMEDVPIAALHITSITVGARRAGDKTKLGTSKQTIWARFTWDGGKTMNPVCADRLLDTAEGLAKLDAFAAEKGKDRKARDARKVLRAVLAGLKDKKSVKRKRDGEEQTPASDDPPHAQDDDQDDDQDDHQDDHQDDDQDDDQAPRFTFEEIIEPVPHRLSIVCSPNDDSDTTVSFKLLNCDCDNGAAGVGVCKTDLSSRASAYGYGAFLTWSDGVQFLDGTESKSREFAVGSVVKFLYSPKKYTIRRFVNEKELFPLVIGGPGATRGVPRSFSFAVSGLTKGVRWQRIE